MSDALPPVPHLPPNRVKPSGDPSSPDAGAPTTQQLIQTLTYAKRHGARFVGRFKQIDFKKEIWPLDAESAKKLASQPAFWAVTLLAALPLFFTTMNQLDHRLVAFAVYFAVIWGLIFRFNVVPGVKIGWGWLAATMLFTPTVGVFILLHVFYGFMPLLYYNLPDSSHDAITRLLGFVFRVGICEESCKIIPVIALMLMLRKRISYSDIIMIGVFSGLGFAAVENLQYFHAHPGELFNSFTSGTADMNAADPDAGAAALHQMLDYTSETAILLALSRIISLTFGHAVYTAIFAHFLAQGRGAGVKQLPLWIAGLLTASVLHGMYDWLWEIQITLPAVVTVISFMLLKLYVLQGTAEIETTIPPGVGSIPDVQTAATS